MRRWHALPLAALVAFATGVVLFSAASPVTTQAQSTPDYTIAIDCDIATAGIQTSCTAPSGTTSYTVSVVIRNEPGGAGDDNIAAFQFKVEASPLAFFNPPAGADNDKNSNPNFSESGVGNGNPSFNCSLVPPDNDTGETAGVATSSLTCFATSATAIADGATVELATILYNTTDGLATLTIRDVQVGNLDGVELGSCNPLNVFEATCPTTEVNIGASTAPTATFTPTVTSTPTPTATPCQQDCPPTATPTSLAFDTVTPTPGPETPTVPAGETPGVPPTTGPGGGEPTAPGGGTGGSGGRPGITLPDTGEGANAGVNWSQAVLLSVIAMTLGGLAGGAYLGALVVARKRGQ